MKKRKLSPLNVIFSAVLLVVFCGFLIGVMIWERNRPGSDEPVQTPNVVQTNPSATEETTASITLPHETTLPEYKARRINFLLVGRDWHDEGENGRSDAMILCSVDTVDKTVTMISFLRDIYLKIPGHGSNRLNAAYSWGGAELLKETLEQNFDVHTDVTLEIDFDGFESMVDYLGGVDIELTDQEAAYLNKTYDWELNGGVSRLNGEEALAYSRIRFLDSDFVRTERQRNVLISLIEKYQNATLQEMLCVTDEFLDQSTSDHTDEELLGYALELHSMLADSTVATHRVPADGTYSYETIRGMSVIEVDFEKNRSILKTLFGDE